MKGRIWVIGILVVLLFSSLAVEFWSSNANGNPAKKVNMNKNVKGYIYIQHSIIRINGNADFNSTNGVVGGSGTQSDPYIISGWDIDAHGAGNAIYIGNTTAYFIIENSYLHNASYHSWPYFKGAGITLLYNVENGIIKNNTCSNNDYGIELGYSSNNNILENNTCSNNHYGIWLDDSRSNRLYSNKLVNNGILLGWDTDTFATEDIPTNNTVNGKPVYYYKNVNMNNATVPLDAGQVILGNVSWLKIENLNIHNASVAIEIGYSSHITVRNNTCSNNHYGIYLEGPSNNKLENNTCSNNGEGIWLDYSSSNRLYSNKLVNNGIFLWGDKDTFATEDIPTNNTVNGKPVYYYKNVNMNNATVPLDAGQVILGNVSWLKIENLNIHNASVAIEIGYSSHITVRNNTCSNSSWNGIALYSSSHNKLENNTCNHNSGYGDGIELGYSSNNNILENNTCSSNGWYGIDVWDSSNNMLINNTCSNNGNYGIELEWGSSSNVIADNLISHNAYYGIYIDSGSKNRIYNNSFYYNHGSGDTYDSSHVQACDDGTNNYWNSTSGIGNYWHDWANNNDTNDNNNDGIVDWPYKIDGSAGAKDYYPLKTPSGGTIPEFSTGIWMAILIIIALLGVIRFRKFS